MYRVKQEPEMGRSSAEVEVRLNGYVVKAGAYMARERFLQRVSIASYAKRCISYDRFCPTV